MTRPALLLLLLAAANADLTPDFQDWLKSNGYSKWITDFVRPDMDGYGSYGGRSTKGQKVNNEPVIMIHGNSAQALTEPGQKYTGWNITIDYFQKQGYSSAELYAITWGPADPSEAAEQTHSCEYIQILRNFANAVIEYTGASKVDFISHSMGVTLARKVVHGGPLTDDDGTVCQIGDPLTPKVDSFLGMCGGNRGLTACFGPDSKIFKGCNKVNGFFPGYCITPCEIADDLSKVLKEMNEKPGIEGDHIYSFWSHVDEAIGGMDLVYWLPTSRILGQEGERTSFEKSHNEMKDQTAEWQYDAVVNHKLE